MNHRMTMADHVRELTQTTTHREHYEYRREHRGSSTTYAADHVTLNPPLIQQLWSSVTPAGQGGEVGATTAASRPAANLDAIDAARDIDLAAARWIRDLGEDDPLDTIACIQRLHGLTASVHHCDRKTGKAGDECCTYHAIEVDIRAWWVRARVLTGWDSPAWKPDSTCPHCSERRTVSIRLSSELATCTSCHATWDEDTIGILAEHIRTEAGTTPPSPSDDGLCRCEWPQDIQPGRMMICPDCGSRYCIKVQDLIIPTLGKPQAS